MIVNYPKIKGYYMKSTVFKSLASIFSILFLLSISISAAATAPSTPQRTTLAELFTATWCLYCVYAEPALSQLSEKYGSSKLIVLEYHDNDELSNNKIEDRSQWYGVQGFPTVQFDGNTPVVGGAFNLQSIYEKNIQKRFATEPIVTLTLSGVIGEQTGKVKVTITPLTGKSPSNLKLRWVIYEDNVNFKGKYYRFVVRDILVEDKLDFLGTQPKNISKTFAINPVWNYSNLGIVVFVQDDKSKEVLQTAVLKAGK
jgi:thiol-disulfide isomerase/thioredoxin